ncbi:MAG: winged helix-turn-helix domain-containing protein [Candidatus Njordarchaeales archaeon]
MKDICKAENTPYPEIEFTDTHFYIVFKQSREYLKMTKREIIRFPEKFPESSQKILEIISQNPRVTIRELSQALNISDRAIKKNISKLKKEGLLKRIGPDKGGKWVVILENLKEKNSKIRKGK